MASGVADNLSKLAARLEAMQLADVMRDPAQSSRSLHCHDRGLATRTNISFSRLYFGLIDVGSGQYELFLQAKLSILRFPLAHLC